MKDHSAEFKLDWIANNILNHVISVSSQDNYRFNDIIYIRAFVFLVNYLSIKEGDRICNVSQILLNKLQNSCFSDFDSPTYQIAFQINIAKLFLQLKREGTMEVESTKIFDLFDLSLEGALQKALAEENLTGDSGAIHIADYFIQRERFDLVVPVINLINSKKHSLGKSFYWISYTPSKQSFFIDLTLETGICGIIRFLSTALDQNIGGEITNSLLSGSIRFYQDYVLSSKELISQDVISKFITFSKGINSNYDRYLSYLYSTSKTHINKRSYPSNKIYNSSSYNKSYTGFDADLGYTETHLAYRYFLSLTIDGPKVVSLQNLYFKKCLDFLDARITTVVDNQNSLKGHFDRLNCCGLVLLQKCATSTEEELAVKLEDLIWLVSDCSPLNGN